MKILVIQPQAELVEAFRLPPLGLALLAVLSEGHEKLESELEFWDHSYNSPSSSGLGDSR